MYRGTDNGMLRQHYRESDPKISTYGGMVAYQRARDSPCPTARACRSCSSTRSDGGQLRTDDVRDAQGVLEWLDRPPQALHRPGGLRLRAGRQHTNRTGVAIFPLGSPPAEGPIGELTRRNTRIWDVKDTNVFAGDALPRSRNGARAAASRPPTTSPRPGRCGSASATAVRVTRAPTSAGPCRCAATPTALPLGRGKDPAAADGLGRVDVRRALAGARELTGAGGRRLGVLPSGKTIAQLPGMIWKTARRPGTPSPPGKYKLSVVGSGSGLATLETRTTAGVTTAQFSARKRARRRRSRSSQGPAARLPLRQAEGGPAAAADDRHGLPRRLRPTAARVSACASSTSSTSGPGALDDVRDR